MKNESPYAIKQSINKANLWKHSKALLGRLDIELTERCNNNCVHCCVNLPEKDETAKSRELTAKEIKESLIEATSLGCLTVRFTGGEPLLREDFEELYIFARKLGLKGDAIYKRQTDNSTSCRTLCENATKGEDRDNRLRHEEGIL